MLQAAIIDNGIVGLRDCYQSNDKVQYTYLPIHQSLALSSFDLLIVPNGSDNVGLFRQREAIHAFLQSGRPLLCFDGWFMDWLPGNRWVMDNSKKTINTRYHIKEDPYGFFQGIDLDAFNFSNGISGWWACGYIEPAPGATVILEDTWQRPIIVLDEQSTKGSIFMTASGPLGDSSYATTDDPHSLSDMARFYHHVLDFFITKTVSHA